MAHDQHKHGDEHVPGQEFPGMGPHDIAAVEPAGPIDTTDYGMSYWERHANAMRMVMIRFPEIGSLDAVRRSIEALGERYYEIGYFERQTEGHANLLDESGVIPKAELEARMGVIEKRFKDTPIVDLPDLPEDHNHGPDHWKEDEKGEGPNRHHLMNLAMQEIMQERGMITADDVRKLMEGFDTEFPQRGARVVARAWSDPEFRTQLLSDALPAIESLDMDLNFQSHIIALENTPDTHNVVVCTLCSCYPRFLMGQPPTWYKSRSYRSRVIHEPRAVLKEFGTELADDVTIKVHDSNADMRYIVVPMRPEGTEGWSEEELEAIITRDCLVGVTLPRAG